MKYGLIALVMRAGVGTPIQVAIGNRLRDAVQSPPLAVALAFFLGSVLMALLAASNVIGGLLTSTPLTLLVLPTLYNWLERDAAREKH